MKKSLHEISKYMEENGIEEFNEPVWISDFFMNTDTGRVIRSLKPILVFPKKEFRTINLYKVGKKGQKLQTTISPYSGSDGWRCSTVEICDTEEESYKNYLNLKEDFLSKYENNVKWHESNLSKLNESLIEDKK